MHGYRNYTCECAEGFFYNVSGRECVEVGQRVNVTLIFRETYYSETFNIPTHKDSISARRIITAAVCRI
ncbi:hypothetical protein OESDEN_18110 [Oesophagostomum dentatum]|uniref:EGF-like domain-containing protein n=1 Tax=Oesophagostomum dentatum TaxID=61180 RepID=A0A0B1SA95_OESDE|nr:hypothetical protein OESDEN_18110 [Oesophagostomum dentatum]